MHKRLSVPLLRTALITAYLAFTVVIAIDVAHHFQFISFNGGVFAVLLFRDVRNFFKPTKGTQS